MACNEVGSVKQSIKHLTIRTLLVNLKESIVSLLFESSPASPISFIIPDKNKLISKKKRLMLTKAKNPTNISLDGISKLDVELLNIFSQKETSFIESITWNSNKVNKDAISLGLD